jgi:hypothetical protein
MTECKRAGKKIQLHCIWVHGISVACSGICGNNVSYIYMLKIPMFSFPPTLKYSPLACLLHSLSVLQEEFFGILNFNLEVRNASGQVVETETLSLSLSLSLFFSSVLGTESRASSLLDKHSTTWTMLPALKWKYFKKQPYWVILSYKSTHSYIF